MREWDASLRIYLSVAKASIENAGRLQKAAEILIDHGHFGPATALAVIGQEETGKALLYTLIGFGLVPVDAIPEGLKLTTSHARKQQLAAVGHVLAGIAPRVRKLFDEVSDELPPTEEVLRPLLSSALPTLLHEIQTFMAEHPQWEERVAAIPANRDLQNLKHRGLYVDVNARDVIGPSSVNGADAAAALNDLRQSVEGIRLFTQVGDFSDEGVRVARAALEPHLEMAKNNDR